MASKAVVAWVYHAGKVLTVSRRNRPLDLGLPGGKVEPGETRLQAIAREVREETGIELLSAELLFTREVPGSTPYETSLFFVRAEQFEGPVLEFPYMKESGIYAQWVPPSHLLLETCTFRDFNRRTIDFLEDTGRLND